jgi:hypothetical protein
MIFENPAELKDRIESVSGRQVRGPVTITEDTTDYMGIAAGTILRLDGNDFFVTGEAKEGRFGIVEQPKFWVKYAYDLSDGSRKLLKLVFHEQFTTVLGVFAVRCTRSPDKESRVLELTNGDDRFMQGRSVKDKVGNNVRILDRIAGPSLYNHVATLEQPHEEYFFETLPGILRKLVGCIEAMDFLHKSGQQHGDIRNDHILIEIDTGKYRWIDFDFTINYSDYDVWSMGNILTYVVGKGIRTCQQAIQMIAGQKKAGVQIGPDDSLLFFQYRLANLRKIYPYVPADMNEMLMRFSAGATDFYEDFGSMARDLKSLIRQKTPGSEVS